MAAPEVTRLLRAWRNGERAALDEAMPLVYDELRRLARRHMARQPTGHTLQTTALVNEAYLKLVGQKDVDCQDRVHFFALAAQAMRHLLVDHARAQRGKKRGGGARRLTLDEAVIGSPERTPDVMALDEALRELAVLDARKSRIVELRYFGGLTIEQAAEVLDIAPTTVEREWRAARAWLHRELARDMPEGGGARASWPSRGAPRS